MAGRVTITASLNELPQGSVTIAPLTISPTVDNLYEALVVDLIDGANTIDIPTWTSGVLIIPPPTNTVEIVLKGAEGDTGIIVNPAAPSLFTLPSSPQATFLLAAGSGGVENVSISFF